MIIRHERARPVAPISKFLFGRRRSGDLTFDHAHEVTDSFVTPQRPDLKFKAQRYHASKQVHQTPSVVRQDLFALHIPDFSRPQLPHDDVFCLLASAVASAGVLLFVDISFSGARPPPSAGRFTLNGRNWPLLPRGLMPPGAPICRAFASDGLVAFPRLGLPLGRLTGGTDSSSLFVGATCWPFRPTGLEVL